MVWFRTGGRDANHAPVVPRMGRILRHGDAATAWKLFLLLSHDAYLSGLGSPDGD